MSAERLKVLIKIALVTFLAGLFGFALGSGDVISILVSLPALGLLVFLSCLRLSYSKLLKGMIVVFFLVPFHYLRFLNFLNFINPLTFLGTILLLKCLLDKFSLKSGPFCKGSMLIEKMYFFFILSAIISSCFAQSKLGAFNWIYYSIVIGYTPFKVITYVERSELLKIVRTLVIVGAFCALEGIGEYCLKYSILYPVFPGRLTSLLGHPLINGLIFSLLLPCSFLMYVQSKEKKFFGCAIVYSVAIILTQARGSWIASTAGVLIILLIMPVRMKIRFLIGVVLFSLTIASVPILRNTLYSRAREYEGRKYSSWNIRLKSIPVAFSILKDKPLFGGGPFNAGRYKDEYATDIAVRKTAFENSYLGILVDFGVVGSLLLFSIFVLVMSKVVSATRAPAPHGSAMYFVLWCLMTMCINMGTFNFDSYRSFSFVMWLFIGLAYALAGFGGIAVRNEFLCKK